MQLTDTQKRILEVGKREFLKKGFKDASMRAVVKEAGFTQGAFYGYYDSKEALFDALVAPAAEGLVSQFKQAQDAHYDLIPEGKTAESQRLSTEYLRYFLEYIYENFDAFKLILCCSSGTKYESFVHDLVELEVTQTEQYYRQLERQGKLEAAFTYLLNQEKYLRVFLEDGDVPMDNNASERAIRGFCIGKKN